tara:strand:+ start:468 stop:728 length:261 start_codon:yes stop_codon:yes gene_type:complete
MEQRSNHVADMESHAKLNAPVIEQRRVAFGHRALDVHGAIIAAIDRIPVRVPFQCSIPQWQLFGQIPRKFFHMKTWAKPKFFKREL